jgi:RNA polymerase sigma-B factor
VNDQRLRRRGDSRARSDLAARYLPLARRLALRYRHTQEPIEDLMQVASLGLVKAIDRWDPERGTAFASLAVPTILGELRRYFRDCTWMVRPPRALQELSLQVMRVRDELWTAQGREPTVADLSAALGSPVEDIVDAVEAAEGRHAFSLDAPAAGGDEGTTQLDLLGDADSALAAVDDRLLADHLVRSLDCRARAVLRMRFELDLHQWEIADRVGMSQQHVCRILRDALATLHRHAVRIPPGTQRAAPA